MELYTTHEHSARLTVYQFELLMCHCPHSSLSTTFDENYGWGMPTCLLARDTLSIEWSGSTPGWNGFDLDKVFPYNGIDNLVVEFRYLGHTGTTVNARAMGLPPADRCLDAGLPTSPSGELMSFLTCMRLHFTPEGVQAEPGATGPAALAVSGSPCIGTVELVLSLESPAHVRLDVLSLDGRLVQELCDGPLQQGEHRFTAGMDERESGIYFAVASVAGSTLSRVAFISL